MSASALASLIRPSLPYSDNKVSSCGHAQDGIDLWLPHSHFGELLLLGPSQVTGYASGVASGLLGELHPGAEPEFGVDVGEVSCHGARGDEEPSCDVLIAESFADVSDDIALRRGQRGPAAG